MMNNTSKQGFVIPLVLMLIAVAMVIITGIYQKGSLFVPFTATMMKRERAKLLALSGVQVAMSQLAVVGVSQDEKKTGEGGPAATDTMLRTDAKAPPSREVQFLSDLLPLLNQWQTFPLKEAVDGIDGKIEIAIACEQGKIDLNGIYDFSKKLFRGENESRGDWKKIMQAIFGRIRKTMGISANLFEAFEKFMKERQYRVNDATELLTLDAFHEFAGNEFYKPSQGQQKDRPLYLLDIFTVYSNRPTLQPWFFSSSIRTALEMKPAQFADNKQKKTVVQGWLKNFQPSMNWEQDWNKVFQPMYGIDYQRLPKGIDAVFETSFDPRLFSVVSYGVVGDVTQRAYAIVERIRRTIKNKTWYDLKIKKFYWI